MSELGLFPVLGASVHLLDTLRSLSSSRSPLLLDREVFLEVQEQVGGGHGPTREEVLAHPERQRAAGVN